MYQGASDSLNGGTAPISVPDPDLAIDQELSLHSWCYELSGHKLLIKSWESMKPNPKFYFSLHQRAHGRKGPLRQSHDVYVQLACGDDLAAMLAHLQDRMRYALKTTTGALPAEDDDAA
jgi:DNA-binding GntR family transcriptional regulator